MAYGEVYADKLTYSTPTGDVTISLSGSTDTYTTLAKASGAFTTVSGTTVTGATGAFTSLTVQTLTSTGTITGTTLSGTTASFSTGIFTHITGLTINAALVSGADFYSIASGSESNPSLCLTGNTSVGFYLEDNASFSFAVSGSGVLKLESSGISVKNQKVLRFYDSDNSNFIGLKAPASGAGNAVLQLPSGDGTSGQALFTNGNNALAWRNIPTLLQSGNYQEFTSSSTWNKPSGCTIVYVECVGGGGGGGGGRRGTSTSDRGGGGGGAGGIFVSRYLPASEVGDTVTVTVAAGGSGGAGASVDSTNGSSGSVGGTSSFGTLLGTPSSRAGLGGIGAGNGTVSGGAGISYGVSGNALIPYWSSSGGAGRAENSTTGGLSAVCVFSAGGGGGGNGLPASTSTPVPGYSGTLGFAILKSTGTSLSASGGGGSAGVNSSGGNGLTYGDGGGGGTIVVSTPTGGSGLNGGNGAFPGGGGGGGGGSTNGFGAGNGGNGASGVVRVWAW